MLTLGELLKRERGDYTQADVTRLTGVPRTKISMFENNKAIPCLGNLNKLIIFYSEHSPTWHKLPMEREIRDAWKVEAKKRYTMRKR